MSGIFGLDAAQVRHALAGVRPRDEFDDEAARQLFARATWSAIAEPGDGVAGALIEVDGAAGALEHLLTGGPSASDPRMARTLAAAVDRWRPRVESSLALRSLHNAAQLGVALLVPGDQDWPAGLDDLGVHAPCALWVRAPDRRMPSTNRSIALVGARAASAYGERIAVDAAAGLSDRGFAIVSGAAYGIDGAAHRATLASEGITVAVLAGGVDRLYPSGHAALLHRIASNGAVVAESPCGTAPTKWRFLQRNRLIAAMSGATVVLEAGSRSGSLNTAGHAAALGRPLGAVPGSVYSASSAGCHRLLREYDAICVRDAADMAELVLGASPEQPMLDGLERLGDAGGGANAGAAGADVDPTERRVLDALGAEPRSTLDIARRSGLAEGTVTAAVGLLGLSGAAASVPGGWVRTSRRR